MNLVDLRNKRVSVDEDYAASIHNCIRNILKKHPITEEDDYTMVFTKERLNAFREMLEEVLKA